MDYWAATVVAATLSVAAFMAIVAFNSPISDGREDAPAGAKLRFPSRRWLTSPIHVSSSWSFSDSWATNVAAVGGGLGSVVGASGGLGSLVASSDQGVFTTMSLLFGGAAALAPLVFAAFATNPDVAGPDGLTGDVLGSAGGLFLAASATLFALVGELCLSGVIAWGSNGSAAEQLLVTLALLVGALVVGVYSARTLHGLATFEPAPPAAEAPAAPPPTRARSFLNGRSVISGTL